MLWFQLFKKTKEGGIKKAHLIRNNVFVMWTILAEHARVRVLTSVCDCARVCVTLSISISIYQL